MTWQVCLEESSGDYYYWNESTSETTWEKPEGFEATELCVYPAETHTPMAVNNLAPINIAPIPVVVDRAALYEEGNRDGDDGTSVSYDADDERDLGYVCPLDRTNGDKARAKNQLNTAARDRVQRWIEVVLNIDLGLDLGSSVQDGQVLCQFLNKIRPGLIHKVHKVQPEEDGAFVSAANIFKAQENVLSFTKGCIKLGVPRSSVFDTLDIIELRDLNAFLHCMTMLGRIVQTFKGYDGPQLLFRSEQDAAMKLPFNSKGSVSQLKNVPTMFRRQSQKPQYPPVA